MARNRKRETGSVRFTSAVRAFLLCLLMGGSGVGYVLQKNKIYELGRQIKVREVQLEKLRWENKIRAGQLAELQIPHKLAERVRALNLGLTPPQPGQVVWLNEPRRTSTNAVPGLLVWRDAGDSPGPPFDN